MTDYETSPVHEQDVVDNPEDSLGELRERQPKPKATLSKQPLFQALFMQSVDAHDTVLQDFAREVVGNLSEQFALKAAKGGAFFQQKAAEGAENTERYQRDQSLRAHLINGMLPALRIARQLRQWNAPKLRYWDETTERLFIAGYMLHDFTKIERAKQTLIDAGFGEGEAPSLRQIPTLELIFREWSTQLGLDAFLQPIGGAEKYLHDLIYIACNTQQLWGTAQAPSLLPKKATDIDVHELATLVSRLADLLAYVAPTPRAVVAHKSVQRLINIELAQDTRLNQKSVAKLVYHHVAENRGVLLNFIHNAVAEALQHELRIPLLFAPSGVVYLEHHTAPDMPDIAQLVAHIVDHIRQTAGKRLINTGKGAKRGNTGFQADDSYNDFFGLREMLLNSPALIDRHIRNNKSPDRIGNLIDKGWTHGVSLPKFLTEPKDARADKIAEWAGFIEKQYEDRLNGLDITSAILEGLNLTEIAPEFQVLRQQIKAAGSASGGIRLWWFWAAAHALERRPGLNDFEILEWLSEIAQGLAQSLPETLPKKALVNEGTWEELAEYIAGVLTLGGTKHTFGIQATELTRYTRAKGSGKAVCALCGGDFVTRKPAETAVSFQPGVYTGRIPIGASDNKRNLCSICALEQLLRQLFVDNLDTGSSAESQRIRYLSFYPSYFFTPETLRFMQQAYQRIKAVRISDKEFWTALRDAQDLSDPNFWQGLEAFLFRQVGVGTADTTKFQRVLRYSEDAQGTFFTVGFRNIDPTETESWILPTLLALVFSVCLDVKVVASDSGVPLLLEASELPETIWLDGAHAAIQALVGDGRLNIDGVGKALARLAAAYLIHLDTEYAPPDENWHRFGPIAHALMESPLYVFYFLKQQQRDGERKIGIDQVERYIGYAETLFSKVSKEGEQQMSQARELVTLYRGFYRAKTLKNANSILRPVSVVADTLLIADPKLFSDEEALIEIAYGELYRFMDRVGKGLADGRFPKGVTVPERNQAMQDFCVKFVRDIFIATFNKDVAALRGKQLNLLRSACEGIYRKAQYDEWAARGIDASAAEEAEEIDDETIVTDMQ